MSKREFSVESAYSYDYRNVTRWLLSHVLRYRWLVILAIILSLANVTGQSAVAYFLGQIFDMFSEPDLDRDRLLTVTLYLAGLGFFYASSQWGRNVSMEFLAQRIERDTREELYLSLLGKSQTFHDRQRVGDIMARATDDVRQLNMMFNPGIMLIMGSGVFLFIPLISIAFLEPQLLIAPVIFIFTFFFALRDFMVRLNPIAQGSRVSFGKMNAGLQETVSGIEVVKSAAQEPQEQIRFVKNASEYRDWFVKQGGVEARYLPLLLLSMALASGFLHAILLYRNGSIEIGTIVSYMGMFGLLRFPTFISIWSFSLVQLGYAGAERIVGMIKDETDLDENPAGYRGEMSGAIEFQNVSFGYDSAKPVINKVSFKVEAGQTVAIVGQTGSGKSTLTKLVNRIYDSTNGCVMIDGIDVKDWSLDSLRSQISVIEQDIFLFSRSLADNIAFGSGETASHDQIQRASRDSQSLKFIEGFEHGFDTKVGERGVTLSGGQRQRIALARAFLTNPRILILDDSTSAIDSATEDEIQQAIRRAQEGRTVLLITHRLSQIRWADLILVMRQGTIIAQGTHEELLEKSDEYRRIFIRYIDDPVKRKTGELKAIAAS